jgi:hypothetical protein
MDPDAWRPFDPVDVKRQVRLGRGNSRRGLVEHLSDEDHIDEHGENYDSNGDFASSDSDYTCADGRVVTFVTHDLLRGSVPTSRDLGSGAA